MTDVKPEEETKGFDEVKEALSISGLVPAGPDSVPVSYTHLRAHET